MNPRWLQAIVLPHKEQICPAGELEVMVGGGGSEINLRWLSAQWVREGKQAFLGSRWLTAQSYKSSGGSVWRFRSLTLMVTLRPLGTWCLGKVCSGIWLLKAGQDSIYSNSTNVHNEHMTRILLSHPDAVEHHIHVNYFELAFVL